METWNWENCLKQWSRSQIEAVTDDFEREKAMIPLDILESGDLSCPGATEEEISMTEERLQITLEEKISITEERLQIIFPPSYREFLKFSNGTRSTIIDIEEFGLQLYSTEDIDFYADCYQDIIDDYMESRPDEEPIIDADYFIYGEEQSCSNFRKEYFQTALLISSGAPKNYYLLNPQVVASNGEWEAWYVDYFPLNVFRYRSFGEMIKTLGNNQA